MPTALRAMMVPACKHYRISLQIPVYTRVWAGDGRCLFNPTGWRNCGSLRTLAGRAHTRVGSVIARLSTPAEEATLVEGDVKDMVTVEGEKSEGNMKRLAGSNILMDVNLGQRHLIKHVEFVKSSPKEEDCPKDGLPEFALVGRSNVGKSSLVNALVNRKEIAQTSKRPGKTQLINHFRINNNWYLVDLPGYGFAKAPTAVKTEWNDFTKAYFLKRKTLVAVMLLVDGSIPPLKIDLDCANWLGRNKIPMTVVFTKCDRRKKKKNGGKPPDENVREFEKQLQESYDQTPAWVMTSSTTGQGRSGKDNMQLHAGGAVGTQVHHLHRSAHNLSQKFVLYANLGSGLLSTCSPWYCTCLELAQSLERMP